MLQVVPVQNRTPAGRDCSQPLTPAKHTSQQTTPTPPSGTAEAGPARTPASFHSLRAITTQRTNFPNSQHIQTKMRHTWERLSSQPQLQPETNQVRSSVLAPPPSQCLPSLSNHIFIHLSWDRLNFSLLVSERPPLPDT